MPWLCHGDFIFRGMHGEEVGLWSQPVSPKHRELMVGEAQRREHWWASMHIHASVLGLSAPEPESAEESLVFETLLKMERLERYAYIISLWVECPECFRGRRVLQCEQSRRELTDVAGGVSEICGIPVRDLCAD